MVVYFFFFGESPNWEGVRVVEDSETTMNLRKPLATTPRMLYSSMHMSNPQALL
jgi:hypothetical protein